MHSFAAPSPRSLRISDDGRLAVNQGSDDLLAYNTGRHTIASPEEEGNRPGIELTLFVEQYLVALYIDWERKHRSWIEIAVIHNNWTIFWPYT